MKERLKQYQEDVAKLLCLDVKKATYLKWSNDYATYVKSGGDRPPKRPPTP